LNGRRRRPRKDDGRQLLLPLELHSARSDDQGTEQRQAIDRDLRQLDMVMTRARDARMISTILSTICGAEASGSWSSYET